LFALDRYKEVGHPPFGANGCSAESVTGPTLANTGLVTLLQVGLPGTIPARGLTNGKYRTSGVGRSTFSSPLRGHSASVLVQTFFLFAPRSSAKYSEWRMEMLKSCVLGVVAFAGCVGAASAQTWVQATLAAPWAARYGHGGVAYDGKIWVLGGIGSDGNRLNDVWYSSDGENWSMATAAAD